MDYDILNLGVACAGKEGFEICYEAAREDFFENISGEDIITEKAMGPNLEKIKSTIAKNKKKIIFLIGAIATLLLTIVAIKRHKANEELKKEKQEAIQALNKAEAELKATQKKALETKKAIEALDKEIRDEYTNYEDAANAITSIWDPNYRELRKRQDQANENMKNTRKKRFELIREMNNINVHIQWVEGTYKNCKAKVESYK